MPIIAARRREEVLNVLLAQCICDTGLTADPENILSAHGSRHMPDVLVYPESRGPATLESAP
jgi:hypothetical protein